MSDYDSIFASAMSGGPAASDPYDNVMKSLMGKLKPIEAQPNAPLSVKAGAAISNEVNSIPRQLGLTARYGVEGLANMGQLVTEPIRNLVTDPLGRLFGAKPGRPLGEEATRLADWLGLPSPQGANERVIGDAARLVAGAGGMAGGARAATGLLGPAAKFVAAQATPTAQRFADLWNAIKIVPEGLAANLGQQLSSAAGAGLAGGAAREAGANPWTQAGAALVGGVGGGLAPGLANGVMSAGGAVKRFVTGGMTPQQMDVQISSILERSGVDYSQIPERARQAMRAQMADALNTGKEMDPAAVSRLADFARTGVTPTRGMVSQNPVQITREMNLAKIGANSSDEGLSGLALMQNQNNARMIALMNEAGAGRGNELTAGRALNNSVMGQQAALRGAENAAWEAAKTAPGYRQPISPAPLSAINQVLGDEALMPFMNPTISRYMEAFQTGQQPFTPQAYRNLQSMLSREMMKGGNEAAAAGAARRALESAELMPLTQTGSTLPATATQAARLRGMDAASFDAIDAVNNARQATRSAYAFEESNPMVRSILSEGRTSDPARIAKSFIINGTADEAATVAQQLGPNGIAPVKDALLTHLKNAALSGAQDEVGKFSASAYRKALDAIGPEKMRLFFSPDEIQQLNSLRRVSSLAMNQPVGSAVNNSNSGALMLGKGLDALAGLSNSIPGFGPLVSQPISSGLTNMNIAFRTAQANRIAPGLLTPRPTDPYGSMLLPALAYGGLLSAP